MVREISEWKERNERFTVVCSRCRQNLEFGDFTSLLCRGPQKYLLKSVLHVQHDYLWFFNQWHHCFATLLLPSPLLFLKLPISYSTSLSHTREPNRLFPLGCLAYHKTDREGSTYSIIGSLRKQDRDRQKQERHLKM